MKRRSIRRVGVARIITAVNKIRTGVSVEKEHKIDAE